MTATLNSKVLTAIRTFKNAPARQCLKKKGFQTGDVCKSFYCKPNLYWRNWALSRYRKKMAAQWAKSFFKIKFSGESYFKTSTKIEIVTPPAGTHQISLRGTVIRKFVRLALSYAESIQKANLEDAKIIDRWLKDPDVNIRTVDKKDVTALFISKKSHFKKKAQLIRKFGVPLSFMGPFTQAFRAYTHQQLGSDRWLYKVLINYTHKSWFKYRTLGAFFRDKNGKRVRGSALLSVLRKRLKSRGDGFIVGSRLDRNTLFLTKIVLTELIDNRLRKIPDPKKRARKREAFWKELRLRSNYLEYNRAQTKEDQDFIGSRSFHMAVLNKQKTLPDGKPLPFKHNPDYMVAHAGYEYGGAMQGLGALHEYIKKKQTKPKGHISNYFIRKIYGPRSYPLQCMLNNTALALGVDCSGYIQHAVMAMSRSLALLMKKRFSTSNMHQELGCKSGRQITLQKPFDCEPRLEPGSIVVGKGHTYIFLGYAQDPRDVRRLGANKAPYRVVTLEAEGNLVRSVGVFFRVMPYEKSKNSACKRRKFNIYKLNPSAI